MLKEAMSHWYICWQRLSDYHCEMNAFRPAQSVSPA